MYFTQASLYFMGATIGQVPSALARLDFSTVRRRARAGEEDLSAQARVRRNDEPEVRAGFGKDTLSPQAAALKTVSTNLRRARELVPTVEEIQEQARRAAAEAAARAEQRRERSSPEEAATPEQEPVRARPAADPRVRRFSAEGGSPGEGSALPQLGQASATGAEANAPAPVAAPAAAQQDGAAALFDVLA